MNAIVFTVFLAILSPAYGVGDFEGLGLYKKVMCVAEYAKWREELIGCMNHYDGPDVWKLVKGCYDGFKKENNVVETYIQFNCQKEVSEVAELLHCIIHELTTSSEHGEEYKIRLQKCHVSILAF
nr:uncharacterized protein LOC107456107 [Parasteatoda tepidariorum]